MKKLLIVLAFFSMSNVFACFSEVQKSLETTKLKVEGYSVELFSDDLYSVSPNSPYFDFLYIKPNFAYSSNLDLKVKAFKAYSSAIGCDGFEYVMFDDQTCEINAIGGGYCD